jgi:metal-responsive CopG/Arc/MetJ family transcriptional regulator
MPRSTRTITISLPPETLEQIERITKEEGRTRSELLQEAVRRYVEEWEWQRLYRVAEAKSREKGIASEEQVNELIHARRHRQS